MAANITVRNFHDVHELDHVGYSKRDITTVYDVIAKQDFDELCDFCLSTKLFKPKAYSFGNRQAMLNYFHSFKRLLVSIGPDYDQSVSEVVVPWDGKSLQGLCGCSWSEVLGRRLLFPSIMSRYQQMFCTVLVMFAMSHIRSV